MPRFVKNLVMCSTLGDVETSDRPDIGQTAAAARDMPGTTQGTILSRTAVDK